MSSDRLSSLLKELEPFFNCPLILNTRHHACLLKLGTGIMLLLRLARHENFFEISTRFHHLPDSPRLREQLFKAALQANGQYPRDPGILAFTPASNQLILFTHLPMETISSEKIIQVLPPFLTKAKLWLDALSRGEVPTLEGGGRGGGGLFGIIGR